jgi:hypothetical protein
MSPMWPMYKGEWLLLELAADHVIIQVILVLRVYRMQEYGVMEAST